MACYYLHSVKLQKGGGLIEENNTLDECLTEATLFQMPFSMRRLFTTILVFCELHDVMGLWKKHYDAMLEDHSRNNLSSDIVQQMVLIDIRNMLQSIGKDIRLFPLPDIDHTYNNASHCLHQNLERRKQELEASKIVSSRNRSDVNRYRLVLTQCRNRLFYR